ncbi:hypothetical protein QT814_17475, partial [Xanthomonas citri pv. citri]
RSVTCRTASILNSSVYRLLLMDTSESAIFHGLEMSRKSWAYHFPFDLANMLPRRPTAAAAAAVAQAAREVAQG